MTETATDTATTGNEAENSSITNEQVFIVDEHTAYKGVDKLFEGVKAKQEYIKQLEADNAELRGRVTSQDNIDKFKEELKQMTEQNPDTSATATTVSDDDRIKEIAQNLYLQQKQVEQVQANVAKTEAAIKSFLGEDAENKLATKLAALGMAKEAFNKLAGENPTIALKLVDIQQNTSINATSPLLGIPSVTVSTPAQNTTNFNEEVRKAVGHPTAIKELFNKAFKDPTLVNSLGW